MTSLLKIAHCVSWAAEYSFKEVPYAINDVMMSLFIRSSEYTLFFCFFGEHLDDAWRHFLICILRQVVLLL